MLIENIRKHYPPALELIPLGLILVSVLYLVFHFGKLPDEIPTHFDITGQPDAWGKKYTLIILLVLQLYLYMQTWLLSYFLVIKPEGKEALHYINMPFVKKEALTPEQVNHIKRQMARMMIMIHILVQFLFLYLIFGSVQTAYGVWPGLGKGILFFVIILIMAPAYYVGKSYRVAKKGRQSA